VNVDVHVPAPPRPHVDVQIGIPHPPTVHVRAPHPRIRARAPRGSVHVVGRSPSLRARGHVRGPGRMLGHRIGGMRGRR
jgi:hypothetical protein